MKKRILIIDDSAPIRDVVRAFVERCAGLEICGEAGDGLEGVKKGVELRPDLIILDFSMPKINGLQTALILHHSLPNTAIILFTLYKDAISDRMAHDAGVHSVVSKTDKLSTLANEVQRLTA
jgi:DNA-binding NarL/FixJ family response regulator